MVCRLGEEKFGAAQAALWGVNPPMETGHDELQGSDVVQDLISFNTI
jgi:hypothetical protein